MALVAVLDPSIRVVRGVAPLDARRGSVVRVLCRDYMGQDAGRHIDRAGINRSPPKGDRGRVERNAVTGEGEDREAKNEKLVHGGVRRVLKTMHLDGAVL